MPSHDQADRLRFLVNSSLEEEAAAEPSAAPPLVVVSGGKGGVGATTIAVRLAMALANRELRTVLVDANLDQPDVAAFCEIQEQGTLPDVMEGRSTILDVLRPGPSGVQVLPGAWAERRSDISAASQQRLMSELARLRPDADVIVVDAGSATQPLAARLWAEAALAIVVTTPDMVAMMDAYATIKVLHGAGDRLQLRVLVNQGRGDAFDVQVEQRIIQACRRFLGLSVKNLPAIPTDSQIADWGGGETGMLARRPAAARIEALADDVASVIAGGPCAAVEKIAAAV
jgi:flagellar biosynthesis protein FlhG